MKAKKERAKPVHYSQELAGRICDRLAAGETLRAICSDPGMPSETAVRKWVLEPGHEFSSQYARAREVGYHKMADDMLEIADDATNDFVVRQSKDGDTVKTLDTEHVQRSRLRVEARKWLLSKALPKVYGDRLDLNTTISETHEQALDVLDRIAAERATGNGQAIEGSSPTITLQLKTSSNTTGPRR